MKKKFLGVALIIAIGVLTVFNTNLIKSENNNFTLKLVKIIPFANAENAQCPCDENQDEIRFPLGIDICLCLYSYQDCCCCSEG
jgi:hypothetical protein